MQKCSRFFNLCSSAADKVPNNDDLRILAMVLIITRAKTASHDVTNVHMSSTLVAQFTVFVSACSSEDFHKYDTRNIGLTSFLMTSLADPGRLPSLASSALISLAASADWALHLYWRWARPRQSQRSCIWTTNLPLGKSVNFTSCGFSDPTVNLQQRICPLLLTKPLTLGDRSSPYAGCRCQCECWTLTRKGGIIWDFFYTHY